MNATTSPVTDLMQHSDFPAALSDKVLEYLRRDKSSPPVFGEIARGTEADWAAGGRAALGLRIDGTAAWAHAADTAAADCLALIIHPSLSLHGRGKASKV